MVEEIVAFGSPFGVGWNAAASRSSRRCWGSDRTDHDRLQRYKDEEFMRLALMGQRLGHQVFIVLEQVGELETGLRVAEEMNIEPNLGVRIKLATEERAAGPRAAAKNPSSGWARSS